MARASSQKKFSEIFVRGVSALMNSYLAQRCLAFAESVGVKHFVICAGARNAPWIQLLTHFQEERGWTLWNHFDERSAAFFALGLTKRYAQPAAVLTTSGTAAAELLPAVVEAYHSALPLIVMTADRPFRFRDTGAPQAIMQRGLYRNFITCSVDAESPTEIDRFIDGYDWDSRSPVHLNIGFEEPESFDGRNVEAWKTVEARPRAALHYKYSPEKWQHYWETLRRSESITAIVLGALPAHWQRPVAKWVEALPRSIPVWADATCGIRHRLKDRGVTLVTGETDWLRGELTHCLRIGEVPSCRGWRDLESESWDHLRIASIASTPFTGLARDSLLWCPDDFDLPDHLQKEVDLIERSPDPMPALLDEHPRSEVAAVRLLSQKMGRDELIYLGNSMPIREWNMAARRLGESSAVFASRGANGIDGQISTWLGLTVASHEETSWVLLGDLTALYDLNGLWFTEQVESFLGESRKLRLVVLNNCGGRIFSRLPALATLPADANALAENRHSISFRDHAAAWGWGYHGVCYDAVSGEFPDDVIEQRRLIVEVFLSQDDSEAFWLALRELS